jgi:hypothetical protein
MSGALHLATPPIGITFSAQRPTGVASFDAPMSEPAEDGRTGRVAAGCVFWARGAEATFSTVAEDHGNCSVGRMTHGLATLADVTDNGDVALLVGSGWVSPEAVGQIPVSCEVTLKGNLVDVVHGHQRRSPRPGTAAICLGPRRFLPERVPLVVKTR